MSGVLGVFTTDPRSPDAAMLHRMLRRLHSRGNRFDLSQDAGAAVAACWFAWENHGRATGAPAFAADDDGCVVVADATLYYRDDLLRRLPSRLRSASATAAERILAAYRAWGERCAERLEGDFAFVVWDAATRTVVAARDFAGRRPLYFAALPHALLIGSAAGALLEYPGCPDDLDLATVAATAAGLLALQTETCYRAVRILPAAHTLVWRAGSFRMHRHWEPPSIEAGERGRGPAFDVAAEELRALLMQAVSERCAADAGPTSVWMSGGWDSTAVFASGCAAARRRGEPPGLRPVSIHYPPNDPGHEDDFIRQTAERWQTPIHWLDIAHIPLLDRPAQRAAERDEPFAHVYEQWNRALARGSRALGARVALDGVGGDQLFQVSMVYLADLLRAGRLRRLAREWREQRLHGWKSIWYWAVLPLLAPSLRRTVSRLYPSALLRSHLERTIPPWMNRAFLERHGVLERERQNTPPRGKLPHAGYEMWWYLTHPYAARVLSCVSTLALAEGVELRSPLYDERIVRFAATRPRPERSARRETKRLLRAAMRGLLPDAVLAPRPRRSGVTSGYLATSLRQRHAPLMRQVFRTSVLAELGMIDANRLREGWREYLQHGDDDRAVALCFTLHTELWMRARLRADPSGDPSLEHRGSPSVPGATRSEPAW